MQQTRDELVTEARSTDMPMRDNYRYNNINMAAARGGYTNNPLCGCTNHPNGALLLFLFQE